MTVKVYRGLPQDAAEIRRAVFMNEQGFKDEFDETDKFAAHIVLYDGETPAGFLIYAYGGDQADIVTFGVVPEYRGKGFSDALLNGSFAFLKIRNVDRVFLEVAVDNPHAISLYRRTGFEQIGKRPQYYRRGNEAIDALVMARGVG